MSSSKLLKERIESIQDTMKITNAIMDTILNLGLNDKTVVGLARLTNNERFAYDSYRRFITMFSDVVMEIDRMKFEHVLDRVKQEKGYRFDTDLSIYMLRM